MSRRLIIVPMILLTAALIAASIRPFVFTAQASSGCSVVSGLSGPYFETQSRNTGPLPFTAGETITVSVTGPGPSGATTMRLAVSGAGGFDSTSASPLSFTIPADGTYDVAVQNASVEDLSAVSVSCASGSTANTAGVPWGGFSDGRLNPDMAENYSLWCVRNNLDVYRAPNGAGEYLTSLPLSGIVAIPVGQSRVFTSNSGPLTIERSTADIVLVKGNNGTNAPGLAVKPFSLTECLQRNGPLPPTPTPAPPPASTPVPTATSTINLGGGASLVSLLVELGPVDPSKDSDGDGVRNTLDLCPDVAAPGLAFGCPDSDGDGLGNVADQCPRAAGPKSLGGCPDTDGDGVSDRYDLCPNFVPPADKPSAYGCLDSDGDSFPNGRYPGGQAMDWCPLNAGAPGVILFMGCPDPDGDGFLASNFPLVPPAYYDDCPDYSLPWNLADGPCPTKEVAPVTPVDSTVSLFMYANQVGSFDNLYVPAQSEQDAVCLSARYGFCID